MKKNRARHLARLGLFCALAIALSALESVFTPLLPPGAKAGLSNIIVMLATMSVGLPSALAIVLVKALFALVTRGVVASLLSLAGGVASAVLLWLLFRYGNALGLFGISILGALCHNVAQLSVSVLLYGGAILAYAPILVFLSVPGGVITASLLRAAEAIFGRVRKKYLNDNDTKGNKP